MLWVNQKDSVGDCQGTNDFSLLTQTFITSDLTPINTSYSNDKIERTFYTYKLPQEEVGRTGTEAEPDEPAILLEKIVTRFSKKL